MAQQEVQRKQGVSIQLEEEHLRTQHEGLMAELNAPTQMKVCTRVVWARVSRRIEITTSLCFRCVRWQVREII